MTGLHPLSAARKGVDRVTEGGGAREDGGCTVCRVNCRLACRCGRTPVQAHANVTGRHGGKGEERKYIKICKSWRVHGN